MHENMKKGASNGARGEEWNGGKWENVKLRIYIIRNVAILGYVGESPVSENELGKTDLKSP